MNGINQSAYFSLQEFRQVTFDYQRRLAASPPTLEPESTVTVHEIANSVFGDPTPAQLCAATLHLWQNTHLVNISSPQRFLETASVTVKSLEEQLEIKRAHEMIISKHEQFIQFIERAKRVISYNRQITSQPASIVQADEMWTKIITKRTSVGIVMPSPYITLFDHGILPHLLSFYESEARLSYAHIHAMQMLWDLGVVSREETFLKDLDVTRLPHISDPDSAATLVIPDVQVETTNRSSKQSMERVYVIDDASAHELDDGVSLSIQPEYAILKVLIAHPAQSLPPSHPLAIAAQSRATSVYVPGGHYGMLPDEFTTQNDFRGGNDVLCFEIKMDWTGVVRGSSVGIVQVRHVKRYTYDQVDSVLATGEPSKEIEKQDVETLRKLHELIAAHSKQAGRISITSPTVSPTLSGSTITLKPKQTSLARKLVADAMVLAGSIAAEYCESNSIPTLYRTQAAPWDVAAQESTHSPLFDYAQMTTTDLVEACKWSGSRRLWPTPESLRVFWEEVNAKAVDGVLDWRHAVRLSPYTPAAGYDTKPQMHFGLKLPLYSRCTSPLRRFTDLLIHWQIRAHLLGQAYPFSVGLLDEMIPYHVRVQKWGRMIERRVSRYYILEWVRRCIVSGNWNSAQPRPDGIMATSVVASALKGTDVPGSQKPVVSDAVFPATVIGNSKDGNAKAVVDFSDFSGIAVDATLTSGPMVPGTELFVRIIAVEPYLGLLLADAE